MDLNTIKQLIESKIPDAQVDVKGDGYHFQVVVISDAFETKSPVARQQMVYQAVMPHIQSGELHALSITARTQQEWATSQ